MCADVCYPGNHSPVPPHDERIDGAAQGGQRDRPWHRAQAGHRSASLRSPEESRWWRSRAPGPPQARAGVVRRLLYRYPRDQDHRRGQDARGAVRSPRSAGPSSGFVRTAAGLRSRQLPHIRLRLLQPEPHVHLAVHRRRGRGQSGVVRVTNSSTTRTKDARAKAVRRAGVWRPPRMRSMTSRAATYDACASDCFPVSSRSRPRAT
jgi:hypothetical protein